MSDMIDRWAAIGLIHSMYPSAPIMQINRKRWKKKYKPYIEAEKALEQLPSAQPEIIHCKDCIWYELPSHKITENCVRWMKSNGILLPIKPDDFCSRAERKR